MAYQFDGGSDRYLQAPGLGEFTNGGMTLSVWHQPRGSGEATFPQIMSQGVGTGTTSFNIQFRSVTTKQHFALVSNFTGSELLVEYVDTNQDFITGVQWWHNMVTYDSSSYTNRGTFYTNGAVDTTTTAATPASGTAVSIDGTMQIGIANDVLGREYDGDIAHLAIWNTELGADEAKALYLGVSPLLIAPQNLIRYCPLDGGKLIDYKTGPWTAYNTPTAVDGPPIVSYPKAQIIPFPPAAVAAGGRRSNVFSGPLSGPLAGPLG